MQVAKRSAAKLMDAQRRLDNIVRKYKGAVINSDPIPPMSTESLVYKSKKKKKKKKVEEKNPDSLNAAK